MVEESKIFKFKGKKFEELQKLSREEFIAMLPSELRRKARRGFTVEEIKLLSKIKEGQKNIKTHCRELPVLPEMVNQKLSIYNGKEFIQVLILDEMLGMRLGELAPTRKIGVTHSGGGAKKTEVRK